MYQFISSAQGSIDWGFDMQTCSGQTKDIKRGETESTGETAGSSARGWGWSSPQGGREHMNTDAPMKIGTCA